MLSQARKKMLWEHNRARAFNQGIEKAKNEVYRVLKPLDEDLADTVLTALKALNIPYWPPDIEAKYTRRYFLLDKRCGYQSVGLTEEEETEYQSLCKELETLPYGYDPQDQEARDSIHEAAMLLRKHRIL
jgi:hypothetical protein